MAEYRFKVGTTVMCNFGEQGWKLGRIVALNYRETTWAEDIFVPYQVLLDDNYTLIYVPEDNDRYCREATVEDVRILKRKDALADIESEIIDVGQSKPDSKENKLSCDNDPNESTYERYRKGRCHCCNDCPKDWSYVELYSEHYRCTIRNDLKITRHEFNLGKFKVGDEIKFSLSEELAGKSGFMQNPTLVRLPPGIIFSDDASLSGKVHFDPHRESEYSVGFVAVSTIDWNNHDVGILRIEINFEIEGNNPGKNFDIKSFEKTQTKARSQAVNLLKKLNRTWDLWESQSLSNRAVCDGMIADLKLLRELCENHPRLDNGRWWAHLGGFHMNVHKLLENTLFECELYLGYALTFGDDYVRYYAEQNLNGCYQKRLLETARFMWYDGIEYILQNDWENAISTFREAALKKDGWGWAVNHGDIWLAEAVATILQGVDNGPNSGNPKDLDWIDEAEKLLEKASTRANAAGVFDAEGHPWISEVISSLNEYKDIISNNNDITDWLSEFMIKTVFWCSQVLAGVAPFPPKCRERLADESALIEKLPGHNALY